MSDLRTAAIKRIHELVESWAVQPDAVWLFGSAARGDGTVDSDVDLLVVRPVDLRADDTTWNEQTMGLNEHVLAWTGNRCDVLEYTAKELGVLARHNDPLVVEILHDAITIAGPAAREMIGR
ncbi:MAG: nucleotidyltransferase domain-containing protein [Ilumatobacteraceae bacterium]